MRDETCVYSICFLWFLSRHVVEHICDCDSCMIFYRLVCILYSIYLYLTILYHLVLLFFLSCPITASSGVHRFENLNFKPLLTGKHWEFHVAKWLIHWHWSTEQSTVEKNAWTRAIYVTVSIHIYIVYVYGKFRAQMKGPRFPIQVSTL